MNRGLQSAAPYMGSLTSILRKDLFMNDGKTEQLAISTVRVLSMEGVQKANSGHPGLPMGSAPMAFELWANHLNHNPANPDWINRDRFVLSAGHGSMLLYSLLHLFGYGLTTADLQNFRQWGSKTAGHPEYGHAKGIETTTGPLGQGYANAVGMAMAEAHLAAKFNTEGQKIIDHYTYVLCGDGCMMEGITSEAASLAGTLALGKLIVLYDDNEISIEGDTDVSFREDVQKRHEAYGFHVQDVADGNDIAAISKAIEAAKAVTDKPSLIAVHTKIAYGSPLEGEEASHGSPLGRENIEKTKEFYGWPKNLGAFDVPSEVTEYLASIRLELAGKEAAWNKTFDAWKKANPELAEVLRKSYAQELPDLENDPAFWNFSGKDATRSTSGKVLNYLAGKLPNMFGGSADLAPSNKTELKGKGFFSAEDRSGQNIHYGVREHAMAAMANGIVLHGGLRSFCSTFFVFTDYMKGAMRLSALMDIPTMYVMTHDSIGVGEDGPTHEPIEHLAALRATPNMYVFRPADGKETAAGYLAALKQRHPMCMVLSRQNLPTYEKSGPDAMKGAYVISDQDNYKAIVIATGSEVEIAVAAQAQLAAAGIPVRVVSMPCTELFEDQTAEYKESVLPKSCKARVSIEAGVTMPWYKYVGTEGAAIGIDHFGASAPAEILYKEFGFTAENVIEKVKQVIG